MADQCATCGATDVLLFTCGYCDRAFCADHSLPHHSCEGFAHPGEHADEASFEWATAERTRADESAENDREGTGTGDAFAANGFRPASAGVGADAPEPRSRVRAPPAVERAPRRIDDDAVPVVEHVPRSLPEDTTPAVERVPRRVTGPATAAVRPLPRRVRRDGTPAVSPRPATPDGQPTPAVGWAPPDPDPEPAPSTAGATAADGGAMERSVPIRSMDTKRSPGRVDRSDPRTLTEWVDQQTYVSLSVKTAALAAMINGALYLGMTLTMYGLSPV